MNEPLKFQRIRPVKWPCRGTSKSAGLDFFIPDTFARTTLLPHQSVCIPSGIRAKIPSNHVLIAFNKSGVATKKHLAVGACVVDEDYQGEIHLHVYNTGNEPVTIEPGEKLVQFILVPISYPVVELLSADEILFDEKTERGEGGFGHTGTK